MPASARLESPGKVLGASRKWLFGCLRRCSTFLDADPVGAVPENRTWTAFSGASIGRSSEAAAAPGLARILAGGFGAEAGAMLWLPPAPGAGFHHPRRHFRRGLCKCSISLALLRGPKLHSRDRASPRPEWGPTDPFPGLRARRPPLAPQLRARAQRLVPRRNSCLLSRPRALRVHA